MSFLLLLLAGSPASLAAPSASLIEEWRYQVSRNVSGLEPAYADLVVTEALRLSEAVLAEQGVAFERVTFGRAAKTAFRISAAGTHSLNRWSARVAELLPGVIPVYAPAELMRGIEGFFAPKDRMFGFSNAMIANGEPDVTFFHEVIHAAHWSARRRGLLDPLSPVARLTASAMIEPGWRVARDADGYARHQTFEELEGYVETLVRTLPELARPTVGRAGLRRLEDALGSIRASAEIGVELARQIRDIAARARAVLAGPNAPRWTEVSRDADGAVEWGLSVPLAAYRKGPQGRVEELAGGAELVWSVWTTSGGAPERSPADIAALLVSAIEAAESLESPYAEVRDSIGWLIERPDASSTDLGRVRASVEHLGAVFAAWKQARSRTGIPVF